MGCGDRRDGMSRSFAGSAGSKHAWAVGLHLLSVGYWSAYHPASAATVRMVDGEQFRRGKDSPSRDSPSRTPRAGLGASRDSPSRAWSTSIGAWTWKKRRGSWSSPPMTSPSAASCIGLGDFDEAHTNVITARAGADAAEEILRVALTPGARRLPGQRRLS